jgi:hypothetical protein
MTKGWPSGVSSLSEKKTLRRESMSIFNNTNKCSETCTPNVISPLPTESTITDLRVFPREFSNTYFLLYKEYPF